MTFRTNTPVSGESIFVSKGGDDNSDGFTDERPVLTVTQAIINAITFSSVNINVADGNFDEALVIPDTVDIRGIGAALVSSVDSSITLTAGNSSTVNVGFVSAQGNNSTGILINGKSRSLIDVTTFILGTFGGPVSDNVIGVDILGTNDDIPVEITNGECRATNSTFVRVRGATDTPPKIALGTITNFANGFVLVDHVPSDANQITEVSVSFTNDITSGATGLNLFTGSSGILSVDASQLDAAGQQIATVGNGLRFNLTGSTVAGNITVQSGGICNLTGIGDWTGNITVESGGVMNANITSLIGNIIVDAGGELDCSITNHTGTVTHNGEINGLINADGKVFVYGGFRPINQSGNEVTINVPTAVTPYDFILPPANGILGQSLELDSSLELQWISATGNIYTTDGTITAVNREAVGENSSIWRFHAYDTEAADFVTHSLVEIAETRAFLQFQLGDGAGGIIHTNSFQVGNTSTVVTLGNPIGIFVYAADYSANFVDRSITDKGYVDSHLASQDVNALVESPTVAEDGFSIHWNDTNQEYELLRNEGDNIYTLDGTIDTSAANRIVTIDAGVGSDGLLFDAIDGGIGSLSSFFIGNSLIDAKVGDGVNNVGFDIDLNDGIRIFDGVTSIGVFYHADYTVTGPAAKGDRWITDKGYTDNPNVHTYPDGSKQSCGVPLLDLNYVVDTTLVSSTFDFSAQVTGCRGSYFPESVAKMYLLNSTTETVFEYDLTAPQDLSVTPVFTGSSLVDANGPNGIVLNEDGTRIYILRFSGANIAEYTLSTPFDLSTAGSATVTLISGVNQPVDMSIYNGGLDVLFAIDVGTIEHWQMPTPYDWSNLTDTGNTFATGFIWGSGGSVNMRSDGRKVICCNNDPVNNFFTEFAVDTPWDITTMRTVATSFILPQRATNVFVTKDGSRMFAVHLFQDDIIREYKLGIESEIVKADLLLPGAVNYDATSGDLNVTLTETNINGLNITASNTVNAFNSFLFQNSSAVSIQVSDGANANFFDVGIGGFQIGTAIGLNGAFYAADYSANFIARSLIDKGYADIHLASQDLSALAQAPTSTEDGKAIIWDDTDSEYDLTPNKVSQIKSTTVEVFSASDIDDLATAGVITLGAGETLTLDLNVDAITSSTRFVGGVGSQLRIVSDDSLSSYSYSGTGTFISGNSNKIDLLNFNLTSTSTGDFLDVIMSTFGAVRIVNCTIVGFDSLGSVTGGVLLWRFASFVSLGSLTTVDTAISFLVSAFFFSPASGTLINMSGSPPFKSSITGCDMAMVASTAFVRIDPALSGDNDFIISGNQLTGGEIFDTTGTTGTFTAVTDMSVALTTIDSVTDSSGVARFNFTVGPTLFVNQEVDIVNFVTQTNYNQTGIITATGAGFFEIASIAFTADDATGDFSSDTVTLTDVSTTLIDGDTLVINTDASTAYDGSATVYNQEPSSFRINRVFTATETGSWDTSGIDHTDPRILTHTNPDFAPSRYIAAAFVNDNSTAVGAIVNNTFTDLVFGTGGSALLEGSTIERFKLIDDVNGTFEYTGNEPFSGSITFDFTVTSTGGTVDFRFRWQKDTGSGFVDLDNPVEALVAVASSAQSVTKTFPLMLTIGDQIKPEITRNTGTSTITVSYATIYATQ